MEKEMTEEEKVSLAIKLRRAESIAKAAGVPLDMGKQRFILSREMMLKLILGVHDNEFTRGIYEGKCSGCQKKLFANVNRPFNNPKGFWDFCSKCPIKMTILNK